MSELVAGIIVLTVFLLINAVIAWFAHKAMKRFPWLLGWLGAVYALLIFMPVISGMFDLPTTTSDLIGAVLALVILGRAAVLAERLRERGERHWLLARLFRRRAQPKVPLARAKAQASRRVERATAAKTKDNRWDEGPADRAIRNVYDINDPLNPDFHIVWDTLND